MHPIIECAADLSDSLKAVASVEPTFMSTPEKEEALVALTEARSQLDALVLRVLAESDDIADAHGLRDAAAWLAVETRTTHRAARRDLALARSLGRHAYVADALAAGVLRTDQARAVVDAVDALPSHVDTETRDRARATMLAMALDHDAKDLGQIGKRILDVVAPELGESQEAAVLAAEEARADASVELTLIEDDGEGRCRGWFTGPTHVGKMLKRHLLALANPARHDEADLKDEAGEWKPLRRRLGEAFVEYVERYPVDRTPQTAGVNATVVVTMTLEQLLADSGTALLDDGSRMSAGQARRLACEAGSSRPCSARSHSRSTSAAPPGSSTRHNASHWACATAAAPLAAARPPPRGATPTTTTRGHGTASLTWPRGGCCAPAIIGWPTTRVMRCASTPTTRSPSPNADRPACPQAVDHAFPR